MSILFPRDNGTNHTFQALKPAAVDLSQAILTLHTTDCPSQVVEQRLEALEAKLASIIQRGGRLDARLADYVFFPVSQVLKHSQKSSLRSLEVSLSIIAELVQHGWRNDISAQLAQQLLILVTLLAGEKPQLAQGGQTTAELQRNALRCMEQLLRALGTSVTGYAAITDDSNIPQLGQTILVLLEALQPIRPPDVQAAAIAGLDALVNVRLPTALLLSFLPGIVSSLTAVLSAKSTQRRRPEVLVGSLECLTQIFRSALGGTHTPEETQADNDLSQTSIAQAAPQIKLALDRIARLQSHDRVAVKAALGQLCMTILRYCRQTLQTCVELAVSTVLALSVDDAAQALHFELVMLMNTDHHILAAVQSVLYSWAQSMVRLMQGADDDNKVLRLQHIGSAHRCLVDAGVDVTVANQLLLRTMQDCVRLILQNNDKVDKIAPASVSVQMEHVTREAGTVTQYSTFIRQSAQAQALAVIIPLVQQMLSSDQTSAGADSLLQSLQNSRGDGLTASFWLLLQHLRHAVQESISLGSMIDIDASASTSHIDELYSFGLTYLSSEEQLPQVSSLSLQALALKAEVTGSDFKLELIDALYPVLHALATPHELVQHDSIVTLNILAKSCAYPSVKELIVENVDYLTNAVALKLNAFDVSPQAPQVLLMMVRLAGPGLVPYLEDTLDSIFAALEDYHGYPLLVELLFKALAVIAEEGAKTPLLAVDGNMKLLLDKVTTDSWHTTKIASLVETLRARNVDAQPHEDDVGPAPHTPWKESVDDGTAEQPRPADDVEVPPPAPKIYSTLVKITELTQHFLPSASPTLRTSLLGLIRTTIPAIARHENTFLPLINTLWPEIVYRLDDSEPSVRISAIGIISILCDYAKDFMRSRIGDLWPQLKSIWADVITDVDPGTSKSKTQLLQLSDKSIQALQRMQAGPEDYSNTAQRLLWRRLMDLLTSIVRSVPISPQMFDDALQMVQSELEQPDVLEAFEKENADAVWMLQWRKQRVVLSWQPPVSEGFVQVSSSTFLAQRALDIR